MELQQEIKNLEKIYKKKIKDFNENDWYCISKYQRLSERFIEKHEDRVTWYWISVNQKLSEKFIEKHENKVYWNWISEHQKLSEKFIEKHENRVYWNWISQYQRLSERFIEKHKDRVYWNCIFQYQKLSEEFIEKYEDRVYWNWISEHQKLSERFIEKYEDKVNWYFISRYQKLSERFIEKHKDRIDVDIQMRSHHDKRTEKQKEKEILEYCKKHNLKVDRKSRVFYAYREHDKWGRGMWNKTISYRKGRYYRDWHCDLNPKNKNSFGLGIFPKGNVEIKVRFEDWGVAVSDDDYRGKARIWGFEIV